MFHLIVLLESVCNCCNNLTTGTYSFKSIIAKDAPVGALIAGLSEWSPYTGAAPFVVSFHAIFSRINVKFISKLISDIFKNCLKLHRYFNGTAILTFFVFPSSGVNSVIFVLYSNDSNFVIRSAL